MEKAVSLAEPPAEEPEEGAAEPGTPAEEAMEEAVSSAEPPAEEFSEEAATPLIFDIFSDAGDTEADAPAAAAPPPGGGFAPPAGAGLGNQETVVGTAAQELGVSEVRQGSHVLIKGRPCRCMKVSVSRAGKRKHGHAKVRIVALDIFTGEKMEGLYPASSNLKVPLLERTEHQVVSAGGDSGEVSLLLDNGMAKCGLNGETAVGMPVGPAFPSSGDPCYMEKVNAWLGELQGYVAHRKRERNQT